MLWALMRTMNYVVLLFGILDIVGAWQNTSASPFYRTMLFLAGVGLLLLFANNEYEAVGIEKRIKQLREEEQNDE